MIYSYKITIIVFLEKKGVDAHVPSSLLLRGENVYYEVDFKGVSEDDVFDLDISHKYFWQTTEPAFIGWKTENLYPQCSRQESTSYEFDVNHGLLRSKGDLKEWGMKFVPESPQVLGVAANLTTGRVLFAWDGDWYAEEMGEAFVDLGRNVAVLPSILSDLSIGRQELDLDVNFGERKFKYEPPDASFKSVVEVMHGKHLFNHTKC